MKDIINKASNDNQNSIEYFFDQTSSIYTFLNPVSYLDARKNKDLFKSFDTIFIDGNLLIKAIQILYRRKLSRRSFDMTSVAPSLFDYCIQENKSIYLVGAKDNEIETAINLLKTKYENLNIIGYRNGYFNTEKEKEEEYNKIISMNPSFVIVGMGIIVQEKFLVNLKIKGFKGIGFTCGGFISQTAKSVSEVNYYPKWIDKYNLRFIYRIYKEKHTRKRYLKAAFIFPILFLKDRLSK